MALSSRVFRMRWSASLSGLEPLPATKLRLQRTNLSSVRSFWSARLYILQGQDISKIVREIFQKQARRFVVPLGFGKSQNRSSQRPLTHGPFSNVGRTVCELGSIGL